jgi:hypothetical protein
LTPCFSFFRRVRLTTSLRKQAPCVSFALSSYLIQLSLCVQLCLHNSHDPTEVSKQFETAAPIVHLYLITERNAEQHFTICTHTCIHPYTQKYKKTKGDCCRTSLLAHTKREKTEGRRRGTLCKYIYILYPACSCLPFSVLPFFLCRTRSS